MKLYHLNPETGRVGVCSATKGKCKFGSDNPHFVDKETAQKFNEKEMEKQNGLFKKLNKNSENSSTDDKDSTGSLKNPFTSDYISQRLQLLPKEGLDHLIKERYKNTMTKKEVEQAIENDEPFYVDFGISDQQMNLDPEDYETQKTFMQGSCSVLAYELSKATDWQIVSFTDKKAEKNGYWQGHISLKTPEGEYLDVEGCHSPGSGEYSNTDYYREDDISREELVKIVKNDKAESLTNDFDLLEKYATSQLAYNLLESEGYIKN